MGSLPAPHLGPKMNRRRRVRVRVRVSVEGEIGLEREENEGGCDIDWDIGKSHRLWRIITGLPLKNEGG